MILFTGGSGLLGRHVRALRPAWLYPSRERLDVAVYQQMLDYVAGRRVDTIIHAAACTDVPGITKLPMRALRANILGTVNAVSLASHQLARLIYISTDYVFRGDRSAYHEDDEVGPTNKYGWSKLGGECAVQLYAKSLIVRTSFSPREFTHALAFNDQWTSRMPVDEFAAALVELVENHPLLKGTVHVGRKRNSVLDYARSLGANPGEMSRKEVDATIPRDTSLDTGLWDHLRNI